MSAPTPPSTLILPASLANVEQIVGFLEQGQLVILPTETVYAIAINISDPAARDRLAQLKGWQTVPPGVLHLSSPEEFVRLFPDAPTLALRLARRAWPGPLSLEIPAGSPSSIQDRLAPGWRDVAASPPDVNGQRWLTLRVPDQHITQAILAQAWQRGSIISLVSATAPIELGGVAEYPSEALSLAPVLIDNVAAILDAGPTRYRKASTLVRVDHDVVQVRRPGVLDERILRRLAQKLILFVCTGNTCRSPMAAALARRILAERLRTTPAGLADRHIVIESAGVHAYPGGRATEEARLAVESLGAELSHHQAQPVTVDLLRRADLVFTMTEAQKEEILHLLPSAAGKIQRLDPSGDVEDPIGGDERLYLQVAQRLQEVLATRLSEIQL
jgi:protein-tyrosine phosphatase